MQRRVQLNFFHREVLLYLINNRAGLGGKSSRWEVEGVHPLGLQGGHRSPILRGNRSVNVDFSPFGAFVYIYLSLSAQNVEDVDW